MRIQKVSIKKFKNLEDLDCSFSGSNTVAFIGNNGSGKSNLLEAITRAFSNAQNYSCGKSLPLIYPGEEIDLQECIIEYSVSDINYTLKYNCGMEELFSSMAADYSEPIREKIELFRNDEKLSKTDFSSALPETVLLYYAGETQRQKGISENTYDMFYERRLIRAKTSDLPGLRFIDYYNIDDLTLLLVVASAYRGEYYQNILKLLGCEEIYPEFSLILKNPLKGRGTPDTYWGATGFVKHFLDKLRKYLSGAKDLGNQYFMFFNDPDSLKNVSENELDLFARLKVLKHYGYLDHIGIQFKKSNGALFSSLRLSEGEKQLVLLYLLTAFTSQGDCLYIFDEFDAYLHLNWQRNFSNMFTNLKINGQVLFTTHSPATISGMKRQNVFIMDNGKVYPARSDTFNRSLDEIMEEQMFVTMRPKVFTDLEKEYRNAVVHNQKDVAVAKLEQIREIVGDEDPFFITASMALKRME